MLNPDTLAKIAGCHDHFTGANEGEVEGWVMIDPDDPGNLIGEIQAAYAPQEVVVSFADTLLNIHVVVRPVT